ncbi:MAG: hypothetical protein HOP18_09320 [Deltaproteobacteria bacterium]|nr:hypothetical protein [Deltaproteobacteria bacterium]
MARKTTPVRPPSNPMASKAGKALATGKAAPKDVRAMAGRILEEREAVTPDKPKPKRK